MEDCNSLFADGVIICCCCPSLILQFFVFILLKLPYKLARKSKRLMHRRLCKRRKRHTQRNGLIPRERKQIEIEGELTKILLQSVSLSPCHACRNTLDEVEMVLDILSQQGQFSFGSFWGREESSSFQPAMEPPLKTEIDNASGGNVRVKRKAKRELTTLIHILLGGILVWKDWLYSR